MGIRAEFEKLWSMGVWNFSSTTDRFMPSGYHQGTGDVLEMIRLAVGIEGLRGLEFIYPDNLSKENLPAVMEVMRELGLGVSLVLPNLHGEARWQKGTLASTDPAIRQQAIDRVKESMDISAEVGAYLVNLWPGQDGYDYPFQADFTRQWDLLIDAISQCADHNPDVRLSLEYKPKEPRTHSFIGTVGQCLGMMASLDRPNIGVTIDVGHSLNCGEDVAESAVLLNRFGDRLFHLHLNDNFRSWDDDMVVGSVHTMEYLELLYWLERTGYDRWYCLDIYPYRESPAKAATASFNMLRGMLSLLKRIGHEHIGELIRSGDVTETLEAIRREMLPI